MGLPLSSTHCSIGSFLGMSLAEYFASVKEIYPKHLVKDENRINMAIMSKIFVWWVVTIPIVFGTTALLTYLLI